MGHPDVTADAREDTASPRVPTVALIGNPNSGKTTLFNALTGLRAKTGNYPGVTVEHRQGELLLDRARGPQKVTVIDLPGTYSLTPRADDEAVAVAAVTGGLDGVTPPDIVVAVCDAARLERSLFFVSQLLEGLGPRGRCRLIVALTMTDTLAQPLDVTALSERLEVPVVVASGRGEAGVAALTSAIVSALELSGGPPSPQEASAVGIPDADAWPRIVEQAERRYQTLAPLVDGLLPQLDQSEVERRTDRLDKIALHPVVGPALMLGVFALLFETLFTFSAPLMDAIEAGVGALGTLAARRVPDSLPLFRSLLVDGVIAGVGNVLVFVPQIAALFLFLGVLEDSGYLARAAFLLDRLMSKVGLSGRAFVPLLSGFACAVPALMATRSIGSDRDRLTTIMVTPLVSCSARLPVYVLILAALFRDLPPLFGVISVGTALLFFLYGLGLVVAIAVAAVLRRTLLRGPPPSMVLELPAYHLPQLLPVLGRALDRVKVFVVDAGTIILAVTVVLWGLFTFPRDPRIDADEAQSLAAVQSAYDAGRLGEDAHKDEQARIKAAAAKRRLEHSAGGRLGHAFEPLIAPLGFNWEMGIGILASFAAREVFVSSLGLVYGLGDGVDEESVALHQVLQTQTRPDGTRLYTPLVGLSLLIFFALAMQCMSTLAACRRETRSYKWPAIQFAYMTSLAWVASALIYQVGRWLGYS